MNLISIIGFFFTMLDEANICSVIKESEYYNKLGQPVHSVFVNEMQSASPEATEPSKVNVLTYLYRYMNKGTLISIIGLSTFLLIGIIGFLIMRKCRCLHVSISPPTNSVDYASIYNHIPVSGDDSYDAVENDAPEPVRQIEENLPDLITSYSMAKFIRERRHIKRDMSSYFDPQYTLDPIITISDYSDNNLNEFSNVTLPKSIRNHRKDSTIQSKVKGVYAQPKCKTAIIQTPENQTIDENCQTNAAIIHDPYFVGCSDVREEVIMPDSYRLYSYTNPINTYNIGNVHQLTKEINVMTDKIKRIEEQIGVHNKLQKPVDVKCQTSSKNQTNAQNNFNKNGVNSTKERKTIIPVVILPSASLFDKKTSNGKLSPVTLSSTNHDEEKSEYSFKRTLAQKKNQYNRTKALVETNHRRNFENPFQSDLYRNEEEIRGKKYEPENVHFIDNKNENYIQSSCNTETRNNPLTVVETGKRKLFTESVETRASKYNIDLSRENNTKMCTSRPKLRAHNYSLKVPLKDSDTECDYTFVSLDSEQSNSSITNRKIPFDTLESKSCQGNNLNKPHCGGTQSTHISMNKKLQMDPFEKITANPTFCDDRIYRLENNILAVKKSIEDFVIQRNATQRCTRQS